MNCYCFLVQKRHEVIIITKYILRDKHTQKKKLTFKYVTMFKEQGLVLMQNNEDVPLVAVSALNREGAPKAVRPLQVYHQFKALDRRHHHHYLV